MTSTSRGSQSKATNDIDFSEVKERSRLTKEEWREYTKTVWQIANVTCPEHPAVFPIEIPRRLIKLFTYWGDMVLDPFAGVGTTARAALECGRRVVCVDQSLQYVRLMEDEVASRNGDIHHANIVEGDARNLEFIENDSVDLIVTSPPYWNKANYGESPLNLGQIDCYTDFLKEMEPAIAELYRVLRPGRKICIVTANVNQHTNHGLLTFPLATDYANILRTIGFVMINEIIWCKDGTGGRWGSWGAQRPIFGSYPYPPNLLFKNVHEYILVFAKPGTTAKTGRTVKNYEYLMGYSET